MHGDGMGMEKNCWDGTGNWGKGLIFTTMSLFTLHVHEVGVVNLDMLAT